VSDRLPNVFKNGNIINNGNNKTSFYSYKENVASLMENGVRVSSNDIDYLFNRKVIIKTRNGKHDCKIVSKLNDHILTSNNEKILIVDIEDIKLKDQ